MHERLAPAKINLALDILGSRPDGYHNLRMVMQSISLCDTIRLQPADAGFTLDADFRPAGDTSLEQQAAEAFFAFLRQPMPGLAVTVEKRVPAYAGLGGGSADAAALLRLLRDRYAHHLSAAQLEQIGLSVGSDVPFCIRCGTCLAEGRGELLTDLPPLPHCWIVLCKPDFDLPTPRLFALADSTAITCRPDIAAMTAALKAGKLEDLAGLLSNVFEEVLPPAEAGAVAEIKTALRDLGALNASMSGSGPTVFGLFQVQEAAERAVSVLRSRYAKVFLAEPVRKPA